VRRLRQLRDGKLRGAKSPKRVGRPPDGHAQKEGQVQVGGRVAGQQAAPVPVVVAVAFGFVVAALGTATAAHRVRVTARSGIAVRQGYGREEAGMRDRNYSGVELHSRTASGTGGAVRVGGSGKTAGPVQQPPGRLGGRGPGVVDHRRRELADDGRRIREDRAGPHTGERDRGVGLRTGRPVPTDAAEGQSVPEGSAVGPRPSHPVAGHTRDEDEAQRPGPRRSVQDRGGAAAVVRQTRISVAHKGRELDVRLVVPETVCQAVKRRIQTRQKVGRRR